MPGIDFALLLFIGLCTLAAACFAYTLLYSFFEGERQKKRRIESINATHQRNGTRRSSDQSSTSVAKRKQAIQNSLKELEENARAKNPDKVSLKDQIKQSVLSIDLRQFYMFSFIAGLFLAVMALLLKGGLPVAGAVFIAGTFGLPRWYLSFRKKRRINAFIEEFPNAIDVITRGIKSGLPLNDCIGIIASESQEPVRTEFRRVLEAQQLGIPMAEAIQKLHRNVPLAETNFFATVIAIQQSAGGNLSEALGNLSNVLRDRKKLKAKIQAMSSEAKASASIIGSLPFIVTILIYMTTPSYMALLFTHTTGNIILIASAVWMSMGIIVMRQMINFDF